jgi:gluconokinase
LNKDLILALDIGTSSVRAALYDDSGNVLPRTMVKNERSLTATDDGGAEIDAAKAFDQVVAAIDEVLEKSEKVEGEIAHVAASSFWHSLVGVDVKGKPTTKVYGWADTRSRDHVATLRKKFDETEVHNRTGARFHSSFWPAKLLWIREESPDVFKKTAKWLSFSDLVLARLIDGKQLPDKSMCRHEEDVNLYGLRTFYPKESIPAFTSISMASATGIFDLQKCEWDAELPEFLGLTPENFPQVVQYNDDTFTLNAKFKRRWERLKTAKIFPAIGDGAANNIGTGCVTKDKAALMIGTSGAMRAAYKGEPPDKIPDGLWCYRIDRETVIMGGALSDGGGLYHWLKQNLRLGKDNDVEAEIAKRPPAGHGLVFLPFLAGERSTGYHEDATGAVLGLRTATDTIDIVQAALESVAYRFAEILDQLNSVAAIREIIASGGALRESPVWTQVIADVLGRDVSLPDAREASSRGAVLLALETIGKIESIEQIVTPKGNHFTSDKTRQSPYQKARKRGKEAYIKILR